MKIGNYIKEYRSRMHISQRELARRCDVSNAYISLLEKDDVAPTTGKPMEVSIGTLTKLAKGMGITLQKLFEDVDELDVYIGPDRNMVLPDYNLKFEGSVMDNIRETLEGSNPRLVIYEEKPADMGFKLLSDKAMRVLTPEQVKLIENIAVAAVPDLKKWMK